MRRSRTAVTLLTIGLPLSGAGPAEAVVVANPQPIVIQPVQFGNGASSPYPSTVTVGGLAGCTVTDVNVTLIGLSHSFPDDVDVLLAGPGGQRALVLSDAGGNTSIVSANLTFDDEAAGTLPDNGQLVTGVYRPTNYLAITDFFPAPAPPAPRPVTLSTFDGTDPNGVWSLYVVDDSTFTDAGVVIGGWSLDLATACPQADLSITKVCDPGTVVPGDLVECSVTVANAGSATAQTVSVTDEIPAGLALIGVPSGGGFGCAGAQTFTCSLKTLAPNQSATFAYTVRVGVDAQPDMSFTNTAGVTSTTPDPDPTSNTASAVITTVACTISGGGQLTGTGGNDVICGSAGPDRIAGLGGDDVILAGGGDDQVTGGSGDDRIFGGAGSDQLAGDDGDDRLFAGGGDGTDRLSGGAGDDILVTLDGAGDDLASGGGHGSGDACQVDPDDPTAGCEA